MGKLFTAKVGKLHTRILGNYLTEALGKVLDIYSSINGGRSVITTTIRLLFNVWRGQSCWLAIKSIFNLVNPRVNIC